MTKIIDHEFTGSGAFAGDGTFSNLAGTVPTLVDAGDDQVGLQFPSGAQSLVVTSTGTLTGRVLLDVVLDLSGAPGGASEIAQLRGAAKVAAIAVTAADRLQVQGTSNSTGGFSVPTGKFRVTLDRQAAGTAVLTIYTDDTGTTVQQTISVACSTADITTVRLGWSASASTVSAVASWPIVATDPADVGPRVYEEEPPPPPLETIFERSYNSLRTLDAFTGDVIQQMIAGTPPTTVRSSIAKGLRWDGSTQGIVEHVYDEPVTAAVFSRVIDVDDAAESVEATGEILQVRESVGQRGPAVSITSDRKLRLIRLSGTTGVSAATTTATIPSGRFRYTLVVNGANLSLTMYPDDTSTTPVEAPLTSTTSDPITISRVREGIVTGTGIGSATTLTSYHPIDANTDPGPRDYPDLPVEGPQAVPPQAMTVEPWSTVTLSGSYIEETYGVATAVWVPPAGQSVAATGLGTATWVAPAALESVSRVFTLRVTDDEGLIGEGTVTVTVRPAVYAERMPGLGWVPVQELDLVP